MRSLRIVLTILFLSALPAFAQPVHIPDPSLNAIIRETIDLPDHIPLTLHTIQQLTHLDAANLQIQDISGLEYATNLVSLSLAWNDVSDIAPLAKLPLTELRLWDNKVSDLAPLANLTTLTVLDVGYCRISDISPLANLIQLEWLEICGNQISDISPLANLTQLTYLDAHKNQISDVRPLASLTRLEKIKITENIIVDYSPLDALPLTNFEYDQTCDMPPLPLEPRLKNRSFPSIISSWGVPLLNKPDLSEVEQTAQHDIHHCCVSMFGLHYHETDDGWEMRGALEHATRRRDEFLAHNPNMLFLVTSDAVWEALDTFPNDSPYWLRDEHGQILPAWDWGLVNLNHPYVQKRIIERAVAVSKCGLYDGIVFDGWSEWHTTRRGTIQGVEAILKGIRDRVRPDFLIAVNANRSKTPVSAPYINGLHMETGIPFDYVSLERVDYKELTKIENTLSWAEKNLLSPQINALYTKGLDEPADSPNNLRWMRAMTTLSLTFSDGTILYDDPGTKGHYWYDFWDADLGRPIGPKSQLYDERPGLYVREYTNGWAVYNHSGKPQIITLPKKAQGVASGWLNTKHALPNLDGEMYLRVKPKNPADVNRDSIVNILDLTLVAQAFGTDSRNADVNGDGVVNVFDLVVVANQF